MTLELTFIKAVVNLIIYPAIIEMKLTFVHKEQQRGKKKAMTFFF